MGLFRTKAKTPNESYETDPLSEKKKKFRLFKSRGGNVDTSKNKPSTNPAASPSNQTLKTLVTETPNVISEVTNPQLDQGDPCPIDENGFPIDDSDLPTDIPKSISAWAPNGVLSDLGLEEQRDDMTIDGQDIDADSLGSPISKFRKSQMMAAEKAQSTIPLEPFDSMLEPQGVDIHNPPSIRYLSYYVAALSAQSSPDSSLRSLFSISEHSSSHKDRVTMVHWKPKKREDSDEFSPMPLVPALLDFLKRCKRDTSEQYLAMLVLNNISIPNENKRCIALDCDGVKILSRLLCQDPGCHLLVIILVNLTFCEAKVRRDLLVGAEKHDVKDDGAIQNSIRNGDDTQLVEALAYVLLLASLSDEQLATLPPIPVENLDDDAPSPRKLLSVLSSNLQRMEMFSNDSFKPNACDPLLTADGGFAETARWSLCALKNLTRPDKLASYSLRSSHAFLDNDGVSVAAHALVNSGVVPLLLRVIRTGGTFEQDPTEVGGDKSQINNIPDWPLNSPQDAALYTLLYMASVPETRETLRDEYDCASEMLQLTECGKFDDDPESENALNLGLQSMKARIALSYLNGSNSCHDQSKRAKSSKPIDFKLARHETHLLVELLSNCLHSRPKDGSGGYSSSSFSLKGILYALRCMIAHHKNRLVFASTCGARLNSLVLKALTRYVFKDQGGSIDVMMDAEAAECCVFCLYLMSNHGFHESSSHANSEQYQFLPAQFGDGSVTEQRIDAKKALLHVLTMYSDLDNTSPAGNHAALQIMLRATHLRYSGTVLDLIEFDNEDPSSKSDFDLDNELIGKVADSTLAKRQMKGVPPSPDIFSRSVVRFQTSASSICVDPRIFSNAMVAVEEISFGSNTTNHSGVIDEIAIANNIVNACDGLNSRAYGYAWRWVDNEADVQTNPLIAEKIKPMFDEVSETERSAPYSPRKKGIFGKFRINGGTDEDEPFSIFGFRCGAPMCGR